MLWRIRDADGLVEAFAPTEMRWSFPRWEAPQEGDVDVEWIEERFSDLEPALLDDGTQAWTADWNPSSYSSKHAQAEYLLLPLRGDTMTILGLRERTRLSKVGTMRADGVTVPAGLEGVALAPWELQVARALHDGCPVVGLFIKTKPGHWCLIVGYHVELADGGSRLRWIINDPARSAGVQYPCWFADEAGAGGDDALHLPYERRKGMPLSKIIVYEPAGWRPDHARFLFHRPERGG